MPPSSASGARESDYIVKDFHFKDGEVLPKLRIHYRVLGQLHRNASGHVDNAVLLMHMTGANGTVFLAPPFAGVLLKPGGLLDASKYFLILPDAIGHGKSSKPSDGLHARFPKYEYEDMVVAEHQLVTDGLGVDQRKKPGVALHDREGDYGRSGIYAGRVQERASGAEDGRGSDVDAGRDSFEGA